ncbi:hypothetical protein CUC08_Gglean013409 [Alternaria sp. MG1]|nr:hypothetical protein CUC08_Gglean013409 [Alternaria sp. MG1]
MAASGNAQNNMAQGQGPPAPAHPVPENDEMLEASDEEEDRDIRELRNLRRIATTQAQQLAGMQDMINQLASQLMATPRHGNTSPCNPDMLIY